MKLLCNLCSTLFLVTLANGQDTWGPQANNQWGQTNNQWGATPTQWPTNPPTNWPTNWPTNPPTNPPVAVEDPDDEVVLLQAGLVSIDLEGQLEGANIAFQVNQGDLRANGQDTITVTYTVPKEAWIAVGFSTNGQMVGSEAVIGLPDTGEVLKHSLNAKAVNGVVPELAQTLIDASIEQSEGQTTMTFTKVLQEPGEIPINIGANTFLGAYGFSNTLGIHERRAAFGVDLAADAVAAGQAAQIVETRKKGLWQAHGICAGLAWGLFSPLAIGVAILRYWFKDGLWFKIHQALNTAVIVLTILAFGFAVGAIQAEGLAHFSPSPAPHRTVGLVVVILAVAQVAGGILRPHTPNEGETKSSTRCAWEIGHKFLGWSILAMAWYQIASGIKRYQTLFVSDTNLNGIFGGIVGAIAAIVILGRIFAMLAEKKEPEEAPKSKMEQAV